MNGPAKTTYSKAGNIVVRPVTKKRWADLEKLFATSGACSACWCMTWRVGRGKFESERGSRNRAAMERVVRSGPPPGLLAYDGQNPVAWCSVAPRSAFAALDRSKVWAAIDDEPVWSISCFYVVKSHRGKGLTLALLRGAFEFARAHGAKILEAYPTDMFKGRLPDAFVWTGLFRAFKIAGFQEVVRRSKTKPIMRYTIRGKVPQNVKREQATSGE